MNTPALGLIHTTPVTVTSMKELATRDVPGVRVINILDDSLLVDVMAAGGVTDPVRRRLRAYVNSAIEAGADAVMSCCSSIGGAIEEIAAESSVPVLRIDSPMAREAVQLGTRIGVLATVRTTLDPTADLIRRTATDEGRTIEIEPVLIEGAYDALRSGDGERHDQLVLTALRSLLARSDVIVLAQASMARLLAMLDQSEVGTLPILSSPRSGLRAAAARVLRH